MAEQLCVNRIFVSLEQKDNMVKFVNRVIRALKLDTQLFEEVKVDPFATLQALVVVIFSSLAGGFGFIFRFGLDGIFTGIMMTLLGWLVWAYCIFLIGTKILPEVQTQSNAGQLFRTIGFADSPGLIRLLGMIPLLNNFIDFVSIIWILLAMIIATKKALNYESTLRAIIVCSIGFIVQLLVFLLFFIIFGGL